MFFKEMNFNFNGKRSQDYDVMILTTESGMFHRPFGINREILINDDISSPTPYYFGTKTRVLKGSIKLCSDKPFTTKRLRDLAEWLYQDDYSEFAGEENPDVFYNIIFTDESEIYFDTIDRGYIELNFTCDSPWAWSRNLEHTYDFRNTTSPSLVNIENVCQIKNYNPLEIEMQFIGYSNKPILSVSSEKYMNTSNKIYALNVPSLSCGEYITFDITEDILSKIKPNAATPTTRICLTDGLIMYLLKNNDGTELNCSTLKKRLYYAKILNGNMAMLISSSDMPSNKMNVSIRNTRNTIVGDELVIKSDTTLDEAIQPNEKIWINMGTGEILSSYTDSIHRSDCCNGKLVTLEKGKNQLEICGNCIIKFRCKYPVII